MGSVIDAADFVRKAGAAINGISPNGGVTIQQNGGSSGHSFQILSKDAALVATGGNTNIYNFTAFDETPAKPEDGLSINLFSNLYVVNHSFCCSLLTNINTDICIFCYFLGTSSITLCGIRITRTIVYHDLGSQFARHSLN